MSAALRLDPELGTERYCAACQEWLPADEEFWRVRRGYGRCRFCWQEMDRAAQQRIRTRRRRVILGPVPCHECRRPVVYGTTCDWPNDDMAPRWRDVATHRIHRCAKAVAA
jgi:hypothetical protein